MAIRKSRAGFPGSANTNSGSRSLARNRMRRMLLEDLEKRQLLAVGPQLIGIQPNNSDLIIDGSVRNQAPRELTFRFDDSQIIHPSSLSGIRLTRAGGDGSFAQPTVATDFGTDGKVDVQLTGRVAGRALTVQVTRADLGANNAPVFSVSGNTVGIALNSNFTTPTTAQQLVSAINASPLLVPVMGASINGGLGSTVIGSINPTYSPLTLNRTGDVVIQPGKVVIGDAPNENEVTLRFAESLPNDLYRAEIFGFDDPVAGIIGLRNTTPTGAAGDLFKPTSSNQRQDTINFRLDLGPQVTAVVPQPVVRNANNSLQQLRDTIVVYFDNDKLLVENNAAGQPTSRSAENPEFYQLIFTDETVRNTDDQRFLPQSVQYNASANTATLRFGQDIDSLTGSNSGARTFRLRIGTRETEPITPRLSEAAATVISDFNTGGAAKFRFTSRVLGEAGSGIQITISNTNTGNPPLITATGRTIHIELGSNNVTAAQLLAALQTSSASSNLVSVQLEAGSVGSTLLNKPINYSPLTVVGLGSTYTTAMNLGAIGSSATDQTSLILSSEINAVPYNFDLIGAQDDAGMRDVPNEAGASFEQYINAAFGADKVAGVTTINYNFQLIYATDSSGNPLTNAITEKQKQRAREVLQIWSDNLGIQFIETPNSGITIATGSLAALTGTSPNVVITNAINMGVQIDPAFRASRLILDAQRQWGDNYGEDWSRAALTGMGMLLGLERAGDLPSGTLMALSTAFVNAGLSNATPADEPVFPGAYDVLHGQHIFRPDSNDIDLYRFEVDFGGADRVGLFVAETYAERLANSSPLDTLLHLYKQRQATATSNLAAGESLSIKFDAIQPGRLGNNLQIFVTRSERGVGAQPIINVFDNLITIDLNSTVGQETTAAQFVDSLNADPKVANLVKVTLSRGSGTTRVGNRDITFSPIVLKGGELELISRNDNYFSDDSFIQQQLSSGVYFIGVSASGNDSYDPTIPDTGFGGTTQGKYDLRVTFRAQVDTTDAIQDVAGGFVGDQSIAIDGDADGVAGGTYNFWFQTRPLDRVLQFNAGGSADLESKIITITGANGTVRNFEFSSDALVGIGNTRIDYTLASTAGDLSQKLFDAIRSRGELGVSAISNGIRLTLQGERTVQLSPGLNNIEVQGRMIFVDKVAGPNADGSLAKPFNNIAGTGVANAFASALPGDIVRIVGNGGQDRRVETSNDNIAYEIGIDLLNGAALSDGSSMDVPQGVTTMIDAGAILKLRRARIGVGSSSQGVDRSNGALQVLGTPALTDSNGRLLRAADGSVIPGSVFFTSWLDQSLGFDTYAPQTTPSVGDWGGITYRRDVDRAAGRSDLEDEGIFLQYVNHADLRYGGGGNVVIDSIQQVVNPIQMIDMRPTVTFNKISNSANAAMSAAPNSFEETNFNEPRFQQNGKFTSDYDRVGPEIHHNLLTNNSLNGLFVRVDTPTGNSIRPLTVAARFDDIDIPYIIAENIFVSATPGGAILDTTRPLANLTALQATVGGTLLPGTYNYKVTFVDINGYETPASDATGNVDLSVGQTAVQLFGLPLTSGEYVARRLYRSNSVGGGQYTQVAQIDATSSGFIDLGQDSGGVLVRDRANLSGVTFAVAAGGSFTPGTFNYRLVMIDSAGRESIASDGTNNITVTANQRITISNLPLTQAGFSGRRLYRSAPGGSGTYTLVAELRDPASATTTVFVDNGGNLGTVLSTYSLGTLRPRLDASLVIDPGAVLKFEGARIEIGPGANLIAEGTDGAPIIFTSKLDDRYGAGGSFDTNNDAAGSTPQARDWGGIYASTGSTLSLDHVTVAYAGGVTKLEGTFKAFNPIELQQADGRITNSTFEFNQDGIGGQGPLNRLGRLDNRSATIFVRGAQPILVGNTFRNNRGSAIDIDANSLSADLRVDYGRSNGLVERLEEFDSNRGPLIRENRMSNNQMNGLEIRGDELMTESVWDDTDIVHVLFNSITVSNFVHEGGLRLQSAPTESLVVKLLGYGANFNYLSGTGITATGTTTNANDRIGGTVEIIGQPGFPVILTSFHDDSVGAGLQPDGTPQTDTNNNGVASIPRPADWRSIVLDQNSNDRNVATVMEIESPTAIAPGFNSTTNTAQLLGDLAGRPTASDENFRLGFVVQGVLSQPGDVDVYSFTGEAGTEVWFDVDSTTYTLDSVIEVLNSNGQLLARSDNSTAETLDPSLITRTTAISRTLVNPLPSQVNGNLRKNASGLLKEDGTTNARDAGLRVVLPGNAGSRSTYHFRIRSSSTNIDNFSAGLTSGSYEVQVRIRESQENPGSSVQYADIRYATNGIQLKGLPKHSPLLGEFQEDESSAGGAASNNDVTGANVNNGGTLISRDQYLGNLLSTDRGTISVGGEIKTAGDLDFYRFQVGYTNLLNNSIAGATVSELEPNDSIASAQSLDLEVFQLVNNPNVQNSTTRPYVVISGTGNGTFDYYSFTVPNAGAIGTFDTDATNFDTELFLFDIGGTLLALNDDAALDPGSISSLDSFISFTFPSAGVYTIGVGRFNSDSTGGAITGSTPITGDAYQLNVSIDGKTGAAGGLTVLSAPVIFDIDYADGLNRADTSLSVFQVTGSPGFETFQLVLYSEDSNIADDQRRPLSLTDLEDFSRGSVGTKDPFIGTSALTSGTYSVAVSPASRIPSALSNSLTRREPVNSVLRVADEGFETTVSNAVAELPTVPRLYDRNFVGVGTNLWRRATDNGAGHKASSVFSFSGAAMTQAGGAQGDLISNAFSLGGYSAEDQSRLYFSYNLNAEGGDNFEVLVRTATGDVSVASNSSALTNGGGWRQARLNLAQFAGQTDLRLIFRYNTNGANTSAASGVSIDDIIIGFAERGEMVLNAPAGATFAGNTVAPNTTLTGQYQLEIRQGESFFTASPSGLTLNSAMDTNDRSAAQVTLVAPEGRELADGDKFTLGDSGSQLTFEFNSVGSVTPGNVAIAFSTNDADYVIAQRIRDAINDPGVQARIKVRAATSGGVVTGTTARDNRINLYGQVSGDFKEFNRPAMSIINANASADTLRNEIFGAGITSTQPAIFDGNAQSAGIVNFGGQTGVMLSTGRLADALPNNHSDNTGTALPGATGDVATNVALGVTTTEATSLQAEFQFGDGTIGGDLFLELAFASEEYNEINGQDVVAVLVDGVNVALVPGTLSPVRSSTINSTTNSQLYYNNDPSDGGKYLRQTSLDGFTAPLLLSALGLAAGPHTLKIVVADVASQLTDSVIFIRSASVGTTVKQRVFGGMQAIFHGGNSDQNTNRDQGQVLIQNNFIRYSRDYGVLTEAGTRLQDPRDLIGNIAPRMASAMSSIPALGSNASGAVRNLREINDAQLGGISTGIVISNNVLENGGLGGVHILGENPIYMIAPRFMPGPSTDTPPLISTDAATTSNSAPLDHFGSFVDDSDLLVIDAGRTRVQFEFEDIAGAGTGGPTFGSGIEQGNNWADNSVPIYYREDGGAQYLRFPGTSPGYSALELLQSIRDSIFGSILVTNGSTDSVRATVAPSVLGRLNDANSGRPGYINFYLSPALYLEGISNINFVNQNGAGNPFLITRVDVSDTPQAFVRVVNNTVYGNDGRASFSPDTTVSEPNDTITTAVETWQGTAHNPVSFTMTAAIGDSSQFQAAPSQDVDLYKFKLDAGERVKVNIDTLGATNLGLDSVLQIFDASGRPQSFFDSATQRLTSLSDNTSAPGEATRLDPYVDFTATKSGVYYAAVSSKGNEKFDPLSLGNRVNGNSTGQYTINLSVLHAQDFTITVQDQAAYNDGETFTIVQIPDFANTTNNTRTFEFDTNGGVAAGNIPIRINANYRAPDVARAIAGAINGLNNGGPVLTNVQQLANGVFGAASPLAPVTARPLGGISGVENGLTLFPRRIDGFSPTHSAIGIGHDRVLSGALSNTSQGDGTTERFVVVSNAAYIISNGNILVDPDFNDNNNLDQILPESGIEVSKGANPTLMNNVFVNVQTPIIRDESRVASTIPAFGNRIPVPFNTGIDVHPKQGEVIIGGSIYQYVEPQAARNRLGFGIEASPTNLPNTGLDFNTTVPAGVQIFVDAQGSQFLPAPYSPIIDSSLDSLEEREAFKTIKQAMGIALSPVKAPSRDATGQLRVDDPSVAPPSGLGADVFKDRGALDRADFVGPSAQAAEPLDNDSGGVDTDKSVSVIQLSGGVYPEFRIQLVDGFETADPFPGIGIDDSTVVGPEIPGVRLTGAAITLFENGRVLREGIDYRFSYDSTTNEVILTPLAGVWKNDRVYEVAVNNKNRFVLTAPAGDQVADGDIFTITDADGGVVYYEFDSGYRLQVPQGLTLLIPLAGGATGGIADGDRFTIIAGAQTVTFEFDRNGNFLAGNRPILFTQGASQAEMAAVVMAAIQASGLPVTPRLLSPGRVFIGAEAGVQLDTTFTTITQPPTTLAFKIPALGPRPGGIVEGQTFTVSDGRRTVTFEYDTDSTVAAGNTPLDFRGAATVADLTALTAAGLANSSLNISPQVFGTDLVYLGLSPGGSASVGTSRLTLNGLARTLTDGQVFSIQAGGVTRTFEFTRDLTVAPGNIAIPVSLTDTQDEIGARVATAIAAAGLGLTPVHINDGNISIGGQASDSINVSGSPSLGLFGKPGVQSHTRLQVFGPLLLTVPARGAADINDNSTFRISNNNRTVVFEFDRNFSGPSQPGNVIISYNAQNTAADIATAIAVAVGSSGLGILPVNFGNGILKLGSLQASQVQVLASNLTTSRGVMNDGETFTINNGTQSVTFEFENVTFGNGFTAGNIPILFSATSTPDSVVQSMKAVIEGSSLGLTTTALPNGILELNDTPRYQIDASSAPTLIKSGVPGGANAVFFIEDANFTGADMVRAIVEAINASPGTRLSAMSRAGNTLFVENAVSISPEVDNYFLRGVADLAGNLLKPNRINNETQFTILMPGVQLDYGDAPDPFTTTAGRYPTKHENDGARHVLASSANSPILLGSTITADANGTPTPDANGDSGDDGVTFDSATLPNRGKFNRNIFTSVTVTLSNPGYADAWIDFNADGDWDDPGEKILDTVRFNSGALTRTFQIKVPDTAPIPAGPTTTFARFRSSSTGGLIPTGLAVDGEVEDYAVIIVPGTPPTAVNDTYSFNEDSIFTTSDPNGSVTPGFLIDDGVAANDQDPEGGPLGVQVVTFPAHALTFNLNSDGTFTYQPVADFNGLDTFTYRPNDGVLTSNNIGTVTINVVTVNDAPVGGTDTQTTDEDVSLNLSESVLLANDTPGPANESAQTIRITGVSPLSDRGGSVNLISGRVIYTPPSNYSGADRFTYTVTDNGTSGGLAAPKSSVVVVNVTVLDKNDAPITVPKSGETNEDTALVFTTAELMLGDLPGPANEAGQSLVFFGVVANSTNGGTVTLSGNQVRYTPRPDFHGTDTFFYEVSDNGTSGGSPDPMIGRGTVTVTVLPVNDTPRVVSPLGTVTMLEDAPARVIDLNTVFFDPDVASNGETLTFTVEPGHNTALVTPTISSGLLNLQLLADKNGSTIITIKATDSTNRSVTTQFSLVVTPVNDAPRLVKALPNLAAIEDVNPANVVLSPEFFFDPDIANGDVLTYSITSNSNPLLVTPFITGGSLGFSLGANRSGSSIIVVQVSDTSGQTVSGTMTLTVAPVNDAPVSVADSYTVPRGTTLRTTDPRGVNADPNDNGVLANDSDPEGNTMTAFVVTQPTHGTVTMNADGTFTYVHDGLSRITDTFTYRASDGGAQNSLGAVTTVTLTIGQAPPPPHQNPLVVGNEDGTTGHRDVNADGFITPIDALLVINFLNTNNGGRSVVGLPAPPPYRDVSGDNFISALDALLVINYLNTRGRSGGGEGELTGEGESTAAQWMAPIDAGRGLENSSIGVRTRDLSPGELYGPLKPTESGDDFFAEVGTDAWSMADTSWADVPNEVTESQEVPVDLAFASLMPDLHENGAT